MTITDIFLLIIVAELIFISVNIANIDERFYDLNKKLDNFRMIVHFDSRKKDGD